MKKTVITISRQYGSGGGVIGEKLAEQLNLPIYDKQLFVEAALRSNIHQDFFEEAETKWTDYISHMYDSTLLGSRVSFGERIFLEQTAAIQELASAENCIIVGRGGNRILKDLPGAFHVYLYADLHYRKEYVEKTYKIAEQDAEKLIRAMDKKRKTYLKAYTGQNWGETQNYHMCIDCGYLGIMKTVQLLKEAYLGE